MSNNTKQNIGIFGILGIAASIFTVLGINGILHWPNWLGNKESIIYQGTILDNSTKDPIAGAKITFLGYQNEIQTCETDDNGLFHIQLPKEYPTMEIDISHDDYQSKKQNKKLTKDFLKTPDKFYLVRIQKKPPAKTPIVPAPYNDNKVSVNGNNKSDKLLQSVYIESEESNFTQRSTIIANKLESSLSKKGYSFTDNQAQARFRLKITATTRHHNSEQGLTVCFADVAVGIFDVSRNKSVFKDEFSQKGISATREAAGRKAIEDAVPIIVNNIPPWDEIIKN